MWEQLLDGLEIEQRVAVLGQVKNPDDIYVFRFGDLAVQLLGTDVSSMKITVIGTGFVGTVTGACLSYLGRHVTFQRGESPVVHSHGALRPSSTIRKSAEQSGKPPDPYGARMPGSRDGIVRT